MSRQVYVSPERMMIEKLEQYPLPQQDLKFNHSRFKEIESEFLALDTDKSGWLSLEEIQQHLKKKGCDSDLVQEIFNDLNVNKDQKISKDEFTYGYLYKEERLKDQVKSLEIKIKHIRIREEEYKQGNTVPNHEQFIITLQSGCLNQLYRQQGDIIKASKQIEVFFQCKEASDGNERFSKPSMNCEYPVWGDKIIYILHQVPQIEISVELIEINLLEKKSLGKLKVQKILQSNFQIQEHLIFEGIGEILVQLEYINNWKEYAEKQIQYCQENIDILLEQIRQIKSKLYFMKQLYNLDNKSLILKEKLIHSNMSDQKLDNQINILFQQQENKVQYDSHQQVYIQQQQSQTNYQTQSDMPDAFNIFKYTINEPEDIIVNLDHINNQYKLKLMYMLVSLITINITFSKCDYLGLILVLLSIPYNNIKWNRQQFKFFVYGMSFSLILDFYWQFSLRIKGFQSSLIVFQIFINAIMNLDLYNQYTFQVQLRFFGNFMQSIKQIPTNDEKLQINLQTLKYTFFDINYLIKSVQQLI